MRATHLATRGVTACDSWAQWPVRSKVLTDVTCTRCLRILDKAREVVAEVREEEARRELCELVGLGEFYARLDSDDPTSEMLRNILASLAKYIVERDYLDEKPFPPLALADPSP